MSAAPDTMVGRYGSGQAVRRLEDATLVVGRGQYADDVTLPGQTHLVFLRSPYAHARITGIDAADARAMPGVIAVYTGAELVGAGVKPAPAPVGFPRSDGTPGVSAARYPLAHGRVRYVGDPVAVVFAEDPYLAEDVADRVVLELEELPALLRAEEAPGEFEPGRSTEAGLVRKEYGDLDAAFRNAHATVSLSPETITKVSM